MTMAQENATLMTLVGGLAALVLLMVIFNGVLSSSVARPPCCSSIAEWMSCQNTRESNPAKNGYNTTCFKCCSSPDVWASSGCTGTSDPDPNTNGFLATCGTPSTSTIPCYQPLQDYDGTNYCVGMGTVDPGKNCPPGQLTEATCNLKKGTYTSITSNSPGTQCYMPLMGVGSDKDQTYCVLTSYAGLGDQCPSGQTSSSTCGY